MLIAHVAGSSLQVDWHRLDEWKPLLNCADSIGLKSNGIEKVTVSLDGARRWIAFQRQIGQTNYEIVGFQETVGAQRINGTYIGGSNRKVLAWLHPDGRVTVE